MSATPPPPGPTDETVRLTVQLDAPQAARDIRDVTLLRDGDLFVMAELDGNIPLGNVDGLGVYFQDTRFLSGWELEVEGLKPTVLLSSGRSPSLGAHVLTNPNLLSAGGRRVDEQTLQIRRYRVIRGATLRESLTFHNFNPFPIALGVVVRLGADFADMFEVRGLVAPPRRGRLYPPRGSGNEVLFHYDGLDGCARATRVRFNPAPAVLEDATGRYRLHLAPHGSASLELSIDLLTGPCAVGSPSPVTSSASVVAAFRRSLARGAEVETDNELFNAMLRQAQQDLGVLVGAVDDQAFVCAGIPWYATLFGRDALWTALLQLWRNPHAGADTLRLLASFQGRADEPWRDEEPGKILHELRRGELAKLGALPFAPYYGSIDATVLWVLLLGEHFRVTGKLALARELRGPLAAALDWMAHTVDASAQGFLEYRCRSSAGIVHQGWKDSWNGIVHADGSAPEAPIALVEVQGYAYAAWRSAAGLLRALGETAEARRLLARAERLRRRFLPAFARADGFLALALDRRRKRVEPVTSNPAHALWAGIVPAAVGESVGRRLMEEDLFSGWGIRTLSTHAASYNPAGYHLGSVWPHDNAVAALGLKRYGLEEVVVELATGLYEAAQYFPQYRMPELFCGFARSAFGVPVRYPVACSPQAWAAASWDGFLQALTGLRQDAPARELRVVRPVLPPWLRRVELRHVPVGDAEVDLRYERVQEHTAVDVTALRGDVHVTLVNRWR